MKFNHQISCSQYLSRANPKALKKLILFQFQLKNHEVIIYLPYYLNPF